MCAAQFNIRHIAARNSYDDQSALVVWVGEHNELHGRILFEYLDGALVSLVMPTHALNLE
jgi:hypothetical protein